MARHAIEQANVRADLPISNEPYWVPLGKGLFLGFRKSKTGGSWIGRQRNEEGKQKYESFGDVDRKTYAQARDAVTKWGKDLMNGVGQCEAETVRDVCVMYVKDRTQEKDEKSAEATAKFHRYYILNSPIADKKIRNLSVADIKEWRANLKAIKGGELTPGSKDRILNVLKAVLNYAVYELHMVSADRAVEWQRVKRLEKKAASRDVYLDLHQRATLIAAMPKEAQPFFRGLCLLPLRPGALAYCRVEDVRLFPKGQESLWIEKDKVNGKRSIPLDKATLDFLKAQCKDKLPKASLFTTPTGLDWNSDRWSGIFDRAAEVTGLPEESCTYSLRHSMITDMINGGVDVMAVAFIAGTSLKEINDHYGKQVDDVIRAKMSQVAR